MRLTRKAFQIPNTKLTLEKGVEIYVSISGIHHDERYYPEPMKFDPERFSAEAVKSRHPMAYLAFGAGPRVCIAERFGKMQTTIGLAMLLDKFQFFTNDKTPEKFIYDVKNIRSLSIKGGINLSIKRVD